MPLDDSDRPQVLAHRRFVADRESLAGLSLLINEAGGGWRDKSLGVWRL